MTSVKSRAQKIAEAIDGAWYAGRDVTHLEVPMGVTAGLALLSVADPNGPDPAKQLLQMPQEELVPFFQQVWANFCVVRPDLVAVAEPLYAWLWDDLKANTLSQAHKIMVTALKAGQMEITGTELRMEVDLLGVLLQMLKGHKASKGVGSFHTPIELAEVMARFQAVEPGASVYEPAAGSGVLLLAAAKDLRRRGHDPASCTWVANDLDPLAAGALAVNVHLWALGPNVLVGCDNGLDDAWVDRALAERNGTVAYVRSSRQAAALVGLLRSLEGGLDEVTHEH